MEPDELLRKIRQSMPHQSETDWAGRTIPDRIQIEDAIYQRPRELSNRQLRRFERQNGRGLERG